MGVLHGVYRLRWLRTTKVVAAQSEHCAAFDVALRNSYTAVPTKCISADGVDLGHRSVAPSVLNMAQKWSKFNPIKSVLVKDKDVLSAATEFGMKERVMIEPLSAVAVAAVIKNKEYFQQFKNIVIIVCGGNHVHFDVEMLRKSQENGDLYDQDTGATETGNVDCSARKEEETANNGDSLDWDDNTMESYDSDTEEI